MMRIGTCSICGGAVIVDAAAKHRCTNCGATPSWSPSAPPVLPMRLPKPTALPLREDERHG